MLVAQGTFLLLPHYMGLLLLRHAMRAKSMVCDVCIVFRGFLYNPGQACNTVRVNVTLRHLSVLVVRFDKFRLAMLARPVFFDHFLVIYNMLISIVLLGRHALSFILSSRIREFAVDKYITG